MLLSCAIIYAVPSLPLPVQLSLMSLTDGPSPMSLFTAPRLWCVPYTDGVRPLSGATGPACSGDGRGRCRTAADALSQLLQASETTGESA